MSLITNIIHNEFALVVENQSVEEKGSAKENLILNSNSTVMISTAGQVLPKNYMSALQRCTNYSEAVAILQHYINASFTKRSLCENSDAMHQGELQQICLTYYDETNKKFCSYSMFLSNQERNVDIKYSISNQVLFRCIGDLKEQMTSLFQLKGVQHSLQQFAIKKEGVNAVMDIVDLTERMYDAIDLVDNSVTFDNSATFWVIDRDTKTFQKIEYDNHYIDNNKYSDTEDKNQNTNVA